MSKPNIIIDFDSTFVTEEGLPNLARIALKDNPERERIVKEIRTITDLGMAGAIGFTESLERRIGLLGADRTHVEELAGYFRGRVTPSIARHRDFFLHNAARIYVLTGGFREFVLPALAPFGIPVKNIFANTFLFDPDGNIIGFDKTNVLSQAEGKIKLLKTLALGPDTVIIGDGYTDYEMKAAGLARTFIAFTENACRLNVARAADRIAASFDEVIEEL